MNETERHLWRVSMWLKFILMGLFAISVGGCGGPVPFFYPDPVALHWPQGDLVFVSNRATPIKRAGFDGPLLFLDVDNQRWAPIENSQPELTVGIAPTWSADGQSLAFVTVIGSRDAPDDPEIHGYYGTMLLDLQSNRRVFGEKRYAITWSPDGDRVAFYYAKGDDISLRVSRPDGTEERIVAPDLLSELYHDQLRIEDVRVAWSPDGEYLAYDSLDEQGAKTIWRVPVQGGVPQQMVAGSHPAWSPLSQELVFDRDGSVWLIDLETNQEELLVEAADDPWLYDGWPVWSPDARQIAFVNSREGNAEIYRINHDGSGLENLTNHPSYDGFPAWRP